MRYSSILTVILWLCFVIPAQASIVLQQSNGSSGDAGTAYNFPQYGGGQLFTATSSFEIQSVEFYPSLTTNDAVTGCARAHIYNSVADVIGSEIVESSNCIDASDFAISPLNSTSTWSFVSTEITNGNQYLISIEWEGSLPANPPIFVMKHGGNNGFGNRCGLFGSWNCGTPNSEYAFVAYDTGGIDTTTHIIEVLPENGTTTSNPVTFSLEAYIGSEVVDEDMNLRIILENIDQNYLFGLGYIFGDNLVLYDDYPTTSGAFFYSTTTTIAEGNYRIHAEIRNQRLIIYDIIDEVDNQFIVGQSTFIGNISQNSWTAIQGIYGSSTATSTEALADSCTPWSGDFSTTDCLAFLFIPDAGLIYDSLGNFKDKILTRFPLGYVTDFVSIMSTSSTSTLIFFNFTTPSGMRFAPVTFTFDAYRSMDWFLYATTTSEWNSAGAVSEQTWFEITNGYWTYVVYFALLMYILRRIIGRDLIPDTFEWRDRSVQEDIILTDQQMSQIKKQRKENFGDPHIQLGSDIMKKRTYRSGAYTLRSNKWDK